MHHIIWCVPTMNSEKDTEDLVSTDDSYDRRVLKSDPFNPRRMAMDAVESGASSSSGYDSPCDGCRIMYAADSDASNGTMDTQSILEGLQGAFADLQIGTSKLDYSSHSAGYVSSPTTPWQEHHAAMFEGQQRKVRHVHRPPPQGEQMVRRKQRTRCRDFCFREILCECNIPHIFHEGCRRRRGDQSRQGSFDLRNPTVILEKWRWRKKTQGPFRNSPRTGRSTRAGQRRDSL